ncbi:glycosyltransferase family 4 protein [Neisseriaceae bacterium TC5R-5]|nr:glycosyltransferase family 4 protein [Neisseriaceae bacterium TC5R-5]
MKIAHLSSAHPRHDIRIFVKECITLVNAGHDVTLIVADGLGTEMNHGVRIQDVGAKTGGRLARMTGTVKRVYAAALKLQPDIVHFHDPELIPAALRLQQAGIRVIYDVHEDVPRQILNKHWLPAATRPLVSRTIESLENWAARRFDAVVAATPYIRKRFQHLGANAIDVCNYPILEELLRDTPWQQRRNELCYLGGISRIRGIEPIVQALPHTDTRLNLAGPWSESDLRSSLQSQPGWNRVNDLGILDRVGVAEVLARSKIGLVTLFPTPSYVEALPIKLFEYMAAGLPVIASDFPLWRQIVEEAACGLLVDPQDPSALANAVNQLMADENSMQAMGAAGQQAVLQRYSWAAEADKLLALYQSFDH